MKKSIKETKELLEGLGKLATVAKKISEDGKVNAEDLKHLIDLAKEMGALTEAFKGAKEIPAELKDLEKEEVMELVSVIFSIANSL